MKAVRETYRASVISAPTTAIRPLEVVAKKDDQFDLRGPLSSHIEGGAEMPEIREAPIAGLSGSRTAKLNASLAASLTAKFLSAMGVALPAASLKATLFSRTSAVHFAIGSAKECSVSLGDLGQKMRDKKLDEKNTAATIYWSSTPARMLIISRVIQTNSFELRWSTQLEAGLSVEVDALKEILAGATAEIDWSLSSTHSITFSDDAYATFAFSAIECHLRPDRRFDLGMEIDAELLEPDVGGGKMFLLVDEPLTQVDALVSLSDSTAALKR